jgi:hypothetical protein
VLAIAVAGTAVWTGAAAINADDTGAGASAGATSAPPPHAATAQHRQSMRPARLARLYS